MTRLVFIDTETTSLRPDRRAWEIGMIVRDPDLPDAEHQWFVDVQDLDMANADLFSLRVGRFYERHPEMKYADPVQAIYAGDVGKSVSERVALEAVEQFTRGAHLVGAVVNFDADVLSARMRGHGILPSWHYHLIDIEALAVGYLAAGGAEITLPWKSDDLTARVGVEPTPDGDKHTALGDARWAMKTYDKIMAHTGSDSLS